MKNFQMKNGNPKWYDSEGFLWITAIVCPPLTLLFIATSKRQIPSFVRTSCIVMLISFFVWITYLVYLR
jgi:hypothetical protein